MPEFIPVLTQPALAGIGQGDLADFVMGYVTCAEWLLSEEDEGAEGFAPDAIEKMESDCKDFVEANAADLELYCKHRSMESAGHDFWLTRNGHGAGFWDRGLPDGIGDRLTEASRPYGDCDTYKGDDDLIHII